MKHPREEMRGRQGVNEFAEKYDINKRQARRIKNDDRFVMIGGSVYKKILDAPPEEIKPVEQEISPSEFLARKKQRRWIYENSK